jgi:hypothetical protein
MMSDVTIIPYVFGYLRRNIKSPRPIASVIPEPTVFKLVSTCLLCKVFGKHGTKEGKAEKEKDLQQVQEKM